MIDKLEEINYALIVIYYLMGNFSFKFLEQLVSALT